jgi:hypothetical protein
MLLYDFKTIFNTNTMSGYNQTALSLAQLQADPSQHGFADPSVDPYWETESMRLSTELISYPSDRSELSLTPYFTHITNDYVATRVPDTLPENESVSNALGLLAKMAMEHQSGSESIFGVDLVTKQESRLHVQKNSGYRGLGNTLFTGKYL